MCAVSHRMFAQAAPCCAEARQPEGRRQAPFLHAHLLVVSYCTLVRLLVVVHWQDGLSRRRGSRTGRFAETERHDLASAHPTHGHCRDGIQRGGVRGVCHQVRNATTLSRARLAHTELLPLPDSPLQQLCIISHLPCVISLRWRFLATQLPGHLPAIAVAWRRRLHEGELHGKRDLR